MGEEKEKMRQQRRRRGRKEQIIKWKEYMYIIHERRLNLEPTGSVQTMTISLNYIQQRFMWYLRVGNFIVQTIC